MLSAVLTASAGDYELSELKLNSNVTPALQLNCDINQRPHLSQLTLSAQTPIRHLDTYQAALSSAAYETGAAPHYDFLDDLSFAGVPVFLAGVIVKGEKKAFRQDYNNPHANTRLLTSFKTHIDDYTQYFGPAMTLGLKIGGVEGRSDWLRLGVSAAMSYGLMAGLVNSIKYTASELRPDGTTHNSWPSGHTATSFVGATILHKEYGLTVSPWYSVAGYGMATATGVMRVLNNRHWVSDVLSGAGIGIMSGELAYAFSDLIFKNKHLLRGDLADYPDLGRQHPSFFDVSMGLGFGSKDITFDESAWITNDFEPIKLEFRNATVVQAEGAYFVNSFMGIGGRMRVRSSPINGWSKFMNLASDNLQTTLEGLQEWDQDIMDINPEMKMQDMIQEANFNIESDHLTEFALDAGLYFNIPLSKRLAIGTKALVGRSIMQALDINASFSGKVKEMDYDATIVNGEITEWNINDIRTPGEDYECEWDYLTVEGSSSTKYGTGISLTYAYKGNFCWKLFCDYDYTRKTYTMTIDEDHYMYDAMPAMAGLVSIMGFPLESVVMKRKKDMHQFVVGASFSISF